MELVPDSFFQIGVKGVDGKINDMFLSKSTLAGFTILKGALKARHPFPQRGGL